MEDHQSHRRAVLEQQFSSFLEGVEGRNSEMMAEIQNFQIALEETKKEVVALKLAREIDQKEIRELKLSIEKNQAEVIRCKKAFVTLRSCLSEGINTNPFFSTCDLSNSELIESSHAITNGSVGGAHSLAPGTERRDEILSNLASNSFVTSIGNTEESGDLTINDTTPSTTGPLGDSVSNLAMATPGGSRDENGSLPSNGTTTPINSTEGSSEALSDSAACPVVTSAEGGAELSSTNDATASVASAEVSVKSLSDQPPTSAIAKRPRGRPPKKRTSKTPQATIDDDTKEVTSAQNGIKRSRGRPPFVSNNEAARTVPLQRSHSFVREQRNKAPANESPRRRGRPRKDASSPAITSSDKKEANGNIAKQPSVRVRRLSAEVSCNESTAPNKEKEVLEAKVPVEANHLTGKEDETAANKTTRKRGRPPKSSKAQVDLKCLPSDDHPDVSDALGGESCDTSAVATVAPAKKRGRPPKVPKTAESVNVYSPEAPLDTPEMICPGNGSLVPVAVSFFQDSPELSQTVVAEVHVDESAPSLEEPVAKKMKETDPQQLPITEDETKPSLSEAVPLNLKLSSMDIATSH